MLEALAELPLPALAARVRVRAGAVGEVSDEVALVPVARQPALPLDQAVVAPTRGHLTQHSLQIGAEGGRVGVGVPERMNG